VTFPCGQGDQLDVGAASDGKISGNRRQGGGNGHEAGGEIVQLGNVLGSPTDQRREALDLGGVEQQALDVETPHRSPPLATVVGMPTTTADPTDHLDPATYNVGAAWLARDRWVAPKHGVGIAEVRMRCTLDHGSPCAECASGPRVLHPRPVAGVPDTEVSLDAAREHLAALKATGLTQREIADRAGVAQSKVSDLACGYRVGVGTAGKVLAVELPDRP